MRNIEKRRMAETYEISRFSTLYLIVCTFLAVINVYKR